MSSDAYLSALLLSMLGFALLCAHLVDPLFFSLPCMLYGTYWYRSALFLCLIKVVKKGFCVKFSLRIYKSVNEHKKCRHY